MSIHEELAAEVTRAKTAPGFSGQVDDELYRKVISSYVKKMAKAKAEYEAAGDRGKEMAEKLSWEIDYLSRWMPQTLGEEETRALVREAIAELGVSGDPQAVGRVVGHLMKSRRDLDGATVNRIAREELASG